MRRVNSMPEIVVAVLLNCLRKSMTFVLDLTFRWSWQGSRTALLRYAPNNRTYTFMIIWLKPHKGICRHPVAQRLFRHRADFHGNLDGTL